MQTSIPAKIIRTESAALTPFQKKQLEENKNYQLFLAVCSYIIITCFCIYIWNKGYQSTNINNKSFRVFFSESDSEGFKSTVSFASIFVFLSITFFFIKFIKQSVIPLNKAIKKGTKSLLYLIPEKITSATTNRYYISLAIPKHEKIEINKETFDNINTNDVLCIEMLPELNIILHISKDQKEIKSVSL